MRGIGDASSIPTGVPDAFLDTIPEDQSVAQQRVTNLSAASAVASSDSEDDEEYGNDKGDGDEENNHLKRKQQQRRRQRTSNGRRLQSPGSVASSNNAIIESGLEEAAEQSKSGNRLRRHDPCSKRSLSAYILLLFMLVGISVGIYFIVTRAAGRGDNANDVSEGNGTGSSSTAEGSLSGVPTPELTFPPNFYLDLDTEPPSVAPSINLDDIADMDEALLKITNAANYFDPLTPQGSCRYWMTRTDQIQTRVSVDGEAAVQQRYILCVIYYATGGPDQWTEAALPFLDKDLHECDWEGVSCDTDRVAILYLAESNLQGRIPSELIHLSSLQLLSLGENKLTGSIPQGLLELPSLMLIDLSSNSLTGKIPSTATSPTTLSRYSPLEALYLDDNLLEGSVPFFDTLQRMRVQQNLFTGFDPGYSTLQSLTSWKMYDNAISGPLPPFWDAPDMYHVDLALNLWTGSIPESLWNLPSLESLVLHDALLTGTLPEEPTVSNHWKNLWLQSNFLNGTIPSTFGSGWVNLTALLLHSNSLTGTISSSQCDQWPDLTRLETDCLPANATATVAPSSGAAPPAADVICDCCTVCHG